LGDFSPIWLLLEAHWVLINDVAQRNGDILGYFWLKHLFYISTKKISLTKWFDVDILWFQVCFDVDILDFQICILWLGNYFGLMLKILGKISPQSFGHPG
jgi:hypothetical protein